MDDLVKALRAGEQADMDGTLVKVSRQACEEAADAIEALQAEAARLREVLRKIADADRLPTPSYGGVPGQYDYLPRSGRFGMMARAALGDDND
jgi:hypothetical protein